MSEASADLYVDFKGWRFRPPFRCMCCGKMVTIQQFCFGRSCGPCDTGNCVGHQPNLKRPYSGPRALIDRSAPGFTPSRRWANPPKGLKSHPDDELFDKVCAGENAAFIEWQERKGLRTVEDQTAE